MLHFTFIIPLNCTAVQDAARAAKKLEEERIEAASAWNCKISIHECPLPSKDPDYAYDQLKKGLIVDKADTRVSDGENPKPEGFHRVVCISDTHSLEAKIQHIPDGDILIHAGDFTNTGTLKEVVDWMDWMETLPHPVKIVIGGNHDLTLDEEYYEANWRRWHTSKEDGAEARRLLRESKNIIYLADEAAEIYGYRFYGSPWQPEFCGWAFNLDRGKECSQAWDKIPDKTDILVTHGPPLGYGDRCEPSGNRAGCLDLLAAVVDRIEPLYHIFGHIHEGYGATTNGITTFINASTCTLGYKPTHGPIVFDLPPKT